MAAKFFALLTNQGAAKLSNMAALGEKLEITSLAVGDGGGISPTPNQAQTKLVNEVRRAQLNSLSVDDKNDSQIIAEQIIPESVGGWWIREIGLFDADGILIAVANCPETYKATTEEGSGRTQVIRMMLTVSSTDAVTLKVDPSVVLATRQYVDSAVIEVKTYTDNAMKMHVAAANPHSQYLLIENALKELAEAGLVGDVLKNLHLEETVKQAAGAMQKSANGGDIQNVASFRNALQLGSAALASMGVGKNQVLSASDFSFFAGGNGYLYIPCLATTDNPVKIMLQWGTIQTRGGEDAVYNLPYAFPTGGLWAMGCRGTTGYSQAMNVRLANRSQISIQNWAPAGAVEDCCFFAVGYL